MTRARTVKRVVVGIVVALVIGTAGLAALLIASPEIVTGPAAAPLRLPPNDAGTARAIEPPPDGTWVAESGSLAGFRAGESFLLQHGTVVGRTSAVTGSLAITRGEVSSGSFQVDLTSLTVGGKRNASFQQMLDTAKYPDAALILTSSISLPATTRTGQDVTSEASGSLTMHGITRPVTVAFTARYDGSTIESAGSAPILASDWGVSAPFGIQDADEIEFLAVLRRA